MYLRCTQDHAWKHVLEFTFVFKCLSGAWLALASQMRYLSGVPARRNPFLWVCPLQNPSCCASIVVMVLLQEELAWGCRVGCGAAARLSWDDPRHGFGVQPRGVQPGVLVFLFAFSTAYRKHLNTGEISTQHLHRVLDSAFYKPRKKALTSVQPSFSLCQIDSTPLEYLSKDVWRLCVNVSQYLDWAYAQLDTRENQYAYTLSDWGWILLSFTLW